MNVKEELKHEMSGMAFYLDGSWSNYTFDSYHINDNEMFLYKKNPTGTTTEILFLRHLKEFRIIVDHS